MGLKRKHRSSGTYLADVTKWNGMSRTQKKKLLLELQKNYKNVRIIVFRGGNVKMLGFLYVYHEDWRRKYGSEYNKLKNGLISNGVYRRLNFSKSVHPFQFSMFTTLVEKKTNRKVLDDVPFWEVMPHLRKLSAGKIWLATPSAYLKHILSSSKFTKKVRQKWIGLLKYYLIEPSGDYLLLPTITSQKLYVRNNAKAEDFRKMLPNMISDALKYKDHAGYFALKLNKLDDSLNKAKYFMERHNSNFTFLIMRKANAFYQARGMLSFMKRGNWVPNKLKCYEMK